MYKKDEEIKFQITEDATAFFPHSKNTQDFSMTSYGLFLDDNFYQEKHVDVLLPCWCFFVWSFFYFSFKRLIVY